MVRRRIRHRIHRMRRVHHAHDVHETRRRDRTRRDGSKGGSEEMTTKIAIVGAGCAGLGAATALMTQNGEDVTVTLIEANEWIGGRARTTVDGLPVDLGPQFIQDPDGNPWARIAEKRGYEYENPPVDGQYRISDQGIWKTVGFDAAIGWMDDNLSTKFRTATGFRNAPILSPDEQDMIRSHQGMMLSLGSNGLGAIGESAEPWQYVASDRDRQKDPPYKPNWYVKGGLGKLVSDYGDWLLEQFGRRLSLLVDSEVTGIREDEEGTVSVSTADDEEREFDFCIVTIPCGEVKKIRFDPELPGRRTRADQFIRLGSYKKVAFKPSQFPTKIGSKIEEKVEYYVYDQDRQGVWQYFRLPTDPSILICVTAGDFARWLDGQPDEYAARIVVDLLTDAYPNSDADFTPAHGRTVVTHWTTTPHIHGAYSYTWFDPALDPDNDVPLQARLEIAKPHGRIHFAGEATCTQAYGTIHGAYNSGVRAADEILAEIARSRG